MAMTKSNPIRRASGAGLRAILAAACLLAVAVLGAPSVKAAGESWRPEFDQAVDTAVSGDLEGGLAILSRLEQEHPGEPDIMRATAQVLVRVGRPEEALKRFRRLKKLTPNNLTDREAILYIMLATGDDQSYELERQELLQAYVTTKAGKVTRSPNFAREFFEVGKTHNVDAFEFYPDSRVGSTDLYYVFVVRGKDVPEAQILLAANEEKSAQFRADGQIGSKDKGYYLEYAPKGGTAGETAGGEARTVAAVYGGNHPPSYQKARDEVIRYLSERLD